MAKNDTSEWDETAANNLDVGGINIAENCPAANVNNALRELMAQIAGARTGADTGIVTGTPGTAGQLVAWNADGDIVASTDEDNATITSISALGSAADKALYTTDVSTWAEYDITSAGRALMDDADAEEQRATLELGTAATLDAGTAANNLVQLTVAGQLPAVDGSLLTNVSQWEFATAQIPAGGESNFDFTGIPSGVNEVFIYVDADVDDSGRPVIQFGTTSGFVTSGYDGISMSYFGNATAGTTLSSQTGFLVRPWSAGSACKGEYTFRRFDPSSHHWAGGGTQVSGTAGGGNLTGEIDLSAALTQIRITTTTSTFEAGGKVVVGWRT